MFAKLFAVFGICVGLMFPLFSLEKDPWFGDVYEFYLHTGYGFSWFRQVDGAVLPLQNTSFDHLLFADLEFAISPQWCLDIEGELAKTPRQDFGPRSVAAQARYLWYDDVIGDPFSLYTGLSLRYVFPDAVRDISCPYGANFDIEGNVGLGKEYERNEDLRFRLWAYGAVGVANQGSPWVKGVASLEMNCQDRHKWAWFLDGYNGYGSKDVVDISQFHGYAKIRTSFLDLVIRYGYGTDYWGTLRLEYRRRIISIRCPERVDTLLFSWLYSFSF